MFYLQISVHSVPLARGPCPLDPYLVSPGDSDVNQYPWLRPHPVKESEAERELKKAQATRSCLESNLDAVVTSRHGGADVYAVLDALYKDGQSLELTRIQRMVDDHILEAETQLKRELAKVPVCSTTTTKDNKARILKTDKTKPGVSKISKAGGVQSQRSRQTIQLGKENTNKVSKKWLLADTEKFLSQVYGKAPYQCQPKTLKEPYLHYVNTARPRSTRPTAVVETTGVEVKSTKVQTNVAVPLVNGQYYFKTKKGEARKTAGQRSELITMAVPLGSPQTEAGVTISTSFVPPPSLTTSPKHQPKASPPLNVTMVTVLEEEEPVEKKQTLVKQLLPSVNVSGVSPRTHGTEATSTNSVQPADLF
ncbi:uncharacterized protein LOC135467180 [Liolophura sinensis]|uniref:uncharacterized protein LOC135467180 n=1 Tax=Liolophura sinensis TaxID=3198878 RepID=UPI003158FA23